MKRLTRAEQGRTRSMRRLQETGVGRLAESRLEQKEDYGRDASCVIPAGGKKALPPGPVSRAHPLASVTFDVPLDLCTLKTWSAMGSSSRS
jgi:hypothetical protein